MALALLAAGCLDGSESQDAMITDSTGEIFSISCEGSRCSVESLSDELPEPECLAKQSATYSFFLARFVAIAAACAEEDGTWTSRTEWQRPAACGQDSDCPPLLGRDFVCRAGLCQSPDVVGQDEAVIKEPDVWLLCFAPIDRTETVDLGTGLEVHRRVQELVDAACGPDASADTVCTLPLPQDCRQPL